MTVRERGVFVRRNRAPDEVGEEERRDGGAEIRECARADVGVEPSPLGGEHTDGGAAEHDEYEREHDEGRADGGRVEQLGADG